MNVFKRLLRLLFTRSKNVIMSNNCFIIKNSIRAYDMKRLCNCCVYCVLKNKKPNVAWIETIFYNDIISGNRKCGYILKDIVDNKIYDFEDVIKFKPLDYSWGKVLK